MRCNARMALTTCFPMVAEDDAGALPPIPTTPKSALQFAGLRLGRAHAVVSWPVLFLSGAAVWPVHRPFSGSRRRAVLSLAPSMLIRCFVLWSDRHLERLPTRLSCPDAQPRRSA